MRMSNLWAAVSVAVVAAFLVVGAVPTRADWSDNFDGGLEQFWNFGDPAGGTTWTAGSVNDELVLTDTRTVGGGGSDIVFGVVVTESFSDVRMTGVINPSGDGNISDTVMLIFRGNTPNQTFYGAEINFESDQLILYRNDPSTSSGNIEEEPLPDLDFTDSVYLEVEAIGSSLRATAYDAPDGNFLARVVATDETLTTGISGVLTQQRVSSLPVLGVWDDVTSENIVAGDYNDDGVVDAADYTVWRDNVGAPAHSLPNDPNFTEIGLDQYNTWRQHFGQVAAGNGALAATGGVVPEPRASALLLAVAAGMLGTLRYRGRSLLT